MKFKLLCLIPASLLLVYWTPTSPPISIFMIGDSTMANKIPRVYPETGWGQVFHQYFNDGVTIHNHALNGYSTKSFIQNNKWRPVLDSLKEGDYVFIEFGHNDEKVDKPEGSNLADFRSYLIRYVKDTRSKKAIPILLTPIMRRNYVNNVLTDTHGQYPDVIRAVAKDYNVVLIDMHQKTTKLLGSIGDDGSKKLFNWIDSGISINYPKGIKDNSNLNPVGAQQVSSLAIEGISENIPALAKYLK